MEITPQVLRAIERCSTAGLRQLLQEARRRVAKCANKHAADDLIALLQSEIGRRAD